MEILFSKIFWDLTLFDILLKTIILLAIVSWVSPRYGAVLGGLSYAATYSQQLIIDHSIMNVFNVLAGVCLAFGLCKFWEHPFPEPVRWLVFILMLGIFIILDLFWRKIL